MIGKKMKVGTLVFGLALGGGALAGSVLGTPGISSAATSATTAVAVDNSATAATTATPATPAATSPHR